MKESLSDHQGSRERERDWYMFFCHDILRRLIGLARDRVSGKGFVVAMQDSWKRIYIFYELIIMEDGYLHEDNYAKKKD